MTTFCTAEQLKDLCVSQSATLQDALEAIQRGSKQIALVVAGEGRLLGTVTDGDIRRAILAQTPFDASVAEIMQRSYQSGRFGMSAREIYKAMRSASVRHLPLLDEQRVLRDVAWISDLIQDKQMEMSAVVMAGGFGSRLHPLTLDLPKPMLPVGDRPLLEILIRQLKQAGVRDVSITTHYLPEKIEQYFGNGEAFGVDLNYVSEDFPLGTAGALGLMVPHDKPLLVVNGDILTGVDFRAMFHFHRESAADLTVAVRTFEVNLPYGVIDCAGPYVKSLTEKPTMGFFVNAGIYLLEPSVLDLVPSGGRYDMTDLIQRLLDEKKAVASFPIQEYWLDIGQHSDYEKAQEDLRNGMINI